MPNEKFFGHYFKDSNDISIKLRVGELRMAVNIN